MGIWVVFMLCCVVLGSALDIYVGYLCVSVCVAQTANTLVCLNWYMKPFSTQSFSFQNHNFINFKVSVDRNNRPLLSQVWDHFVQIGAKSRPGTLFLAVECGKSHHFSLVFFSLQYICNEVQYEMKAVHDDNKKTQSKPPLVSLQCTNKVLSSYTSNIDFLFHVHSYVSMLTIKGSRMLIKMFE